MKTKKLDWNKIMGNITVGQLRKVADKRGMTVSELFEILSDIIETFEEE